MWFRYSDINSSQISTVLQPIRNMKWNFGHGWNSEIQDNFYHGIYFRIVTEDKNFSESFMSKKNHFPHEHNIKSISNLSLNLMTKRKIYGKKLDFTLRSNSFTGPIEMLHFCQRGSVMVEQLLICSGSSLQLILSVLFFKLSVLVEWLCFILSSLICCTCTRRLHGAVLGMRIVNLHTLF